MLHRKLIVAAAALMLAAPAAALDAEQAQKAAETRQGLLKVVVWNFAPLNAMSRDLIPVDPELAGRNAQRIAWLLSMMPDAFRADTREHDVKTEALPVIWEQYDRFEELAGNARRSAEQLVEVAAGGDEEAVKRAAAALLDNCRACHDDFRVDR
jgi:cytochrome c556